MVDRNLETKDEKDQVTVRSPGASGVPELGAFFSRADARSGFILDIDLDVFVSEGRGTKVMPISFERTVSHEKKLGKHGPHDQSNETDPRTEVSVKEMALINQRIRHFFDQLKGAKEKGILPKVITIADSTILERAYERGRTDRHSMDGGNYTPSCLAFLLNYKVRKELDNLYDVKAFD